MVLWSQEEDVNPGTKGRLQVSIPIPLIPITHWRNHAPFLRNSEHSRLEVLEMRIVCTSHTLCMPPGMFELHVPREGVSSLQEDVIHPDPQEGAGFLLHNRDKRNAVGTH